MSVSDLLTNFKIKQSTLSNHLAILRKAKLVKCVVKGKLRIYSIEYGILSAFAKELDKFVGIGQIGIENEIKYRGEVK